MLSILSLNVQGISTTRKQQLLNKWLEENPHDIVLLQEMHIMRDEQMKDFRKSFPNYNIISSLGLWIAGGVVVMVKHNLEIVDSGCDHEGRIAYAKVSINNTILNVASIYAPAKMTERKKFFEELYLFIPTSNLTVVGGDVNCVPNPKLDRNHISNQTDQRSYQIFHRSFLMPLHLTELFRYKHPKKIIYSHHTAHNNNHSRIDLFFGTDSIKRSVKMIDYTPIGISDHDGLSMRLEIPSPPATAMTPKNYQRWICNPAVVKRESFMPRFRKIWDVISPSIDFNSFDGWMDFKSSLILLLQDEQKQLVKETRKDLRELQQQYRKLATNPSPDNLKEMEDVRARMKKILEEKLDANTHVAGERDLKSLGSLAKSSLANAQANRSKIKFLDHPTKGRVEAVEDLIEVATDFYQNLYKKQVVDRNQWDTLFQGLPQLNEQDREKLNDDLTYQELYKAVREMPKGRAPGEDGLTAEVWEVIFPIVGHRFLQMINMAKERESFSPGFLNALLTLIKKDGATEGSMKGFRPLSLMNLDYKLLSKTLGNRLKLVMDKVIHPNQTYCIPGRMINDNIHLIRSIIEHQQRIRDPIGIIMWDQEKAFDRVDHGYLVAVLRAFGFGDTFIQWIALLYSNGSFKIRMNGYVSKPIDFKSGVRQGCALSAALFIIAMEPLLHRIRMNDLITGVEPPGAQYLAVQRIISPNKVNKEESVKVKVLGYADDLNTIVRNQMEENETMKMLNIFNASSGGKTNEEKTEMLWISDWLPPPHFISKVKLDACTFLGATLDTHGCIPKKTIQQMIIKIKQHLAMWSKHDLSFNERCTIMKTFVLSQIMYMITFGKIAKETIINLQKIINNFFWKSKRPAIAFSTLVGRKWKGGVGLPCIKTMIETLRIKCGLHLVSGTKPALWHYYALINVASKLRSYVPRLWTNLTPHVENEKLFFSEVAKATSKWLARGEQHSIQPGGESMYWQLIDEGVFRTPKCIMRTPHLNEIQFFKILNQCRLPTKAFDVWYCLAHGGLNTRSRLGSTEEEKRCLFSCNDQETTAHLFTACPFFDNCRNDMMNRILAITGNNLGTNYESMVYLKEIQQISEDLLVRKNVVYLVGAYVWSVWTTRNMTIGRYRTPNPIIPCRLFRALTRNLPSS